jgi:hypothetical protein
MNMQYGISVYTSVDQIESIGAASGVISHSVSDVGFEMSDLDRVHLKDFSVATISFKASAGGTFGTGGNITVSFPLNFFNSTQFPAVVSTSFVAHTKEFTSTSFVIYISSGNIPPSGQVTMTLSGLKMGPFMPGSGISFAMSADTIASSSVAS